MEHLVQGCNGVDDPELIELHTIWAGRTPIAAPGVQMQFRQRHGVSCRNEGDTKATAVANRDQISDFSPL